MRIDSHQHFWRYSAAEYPWIQEDWPIRRDFRPEDLAPELHACQLEGCIAVQARQSIEETRSLLALAERARIIKGVVGWVDLRSARLEEQLAELVSDAKLVGVRHVVQDEPDDEFMRRQDFQRGISKLQEFDLAYDILIFARQLPAAIELVRSFPNQPFVLDHLAKPLIGDRVISPWREHLHELAAFPNVMCKVSGLVTEARWDGWQESDFAPYLDTAFEAFGPERLMYGSDWPVALLAATYERAFALIRNYVDARAPDAAARIFGLNAARFYKL
jgi:L-fuconolactonase